MRAMDLDHSDLPRRIGAYRLLRIIGRGGMGEVWLATKKGLDKPCALKVLLPEYARNVEYSRRFLREAQILASLRHGRIVPVFEAGEADGYLFIAMEYIDGVNLRTLCEKLWRREQRRLPPAIVAYIIGEVFEALRHAHTRKRGGIGCTTDDWHRVVCDAMRQALIDLRSPDGTETDPEGRRVDPGLSSEPTPYRPTSLGTAGIVTASVGGLGLLTGAGLIIVGSLPDNPAPGLRQDRDLLPLSRDFYTPGGVTMGVSAAVAAAGIAMVVVDLRRWRARQGSASTSGQRTRLQLTASPWGRGVRVGGRF